MVSNLLPKVPFRFLDKLKNEIQNAIFVFVLDTNNGNRHSKYFQFLYV